MHVYTYSRALLEAFPVVGEHTGEGRLLHFGSRGEKKLNFKRPVELTAMIASLLRKDWRKSSDTRSGKSVGGTDETDNSESVQFTGPNGLKIYADKPYVFDTDNHHRILVFDMELKYLSQDNIIIGGKGSGPGQPWTTPPCCM